MRTGLAAAALAVVLGLAMLPTAALANEPLGACCLPSGTCQDLTDFGCTDRNGSFIGFDTSCARIDCQRAPALSFGGIILAAGLLLTFGSARIIFRRRQSR